MRVVADLHIHSRYAMATSRNLDLDVLSKGAVKKGLHLLGTGDFTHPKWIQELESRLEPGAGDGLFSYGGISWVLSAEVCTVYNCGGKNKKVHHLLYVPDFDCAEQTNELLAKHGNLASDGRPVLKDLTSPELVELVTGVSSMAVVIPAHAWTPWFSVFGRKSGFNSLEECYQDRAGKIFAIETGLSSDPPMNWRLSSLDRVALVSNSDAHSANPWRLGREANVFELERPSYDSLFDAIRSKDRSKFLFTVEVDPSYGKYHFSGHRRCGVSVPPTGPFQSDLRCPKCGKVLTAGVSQRVAELADRPEGFVPDGAIPYKRLLSLYETIAFATGVDRLYARAVLDEQDRLTKVFGSELAVLLEVTDADLFAATSGRVAEAILKMRRGELTWTPGYDGVYGVPRFGG